MLHLSIVTALALALAAPPPGEDEAHRLDRMQTRLLNERAAARLRSVAPAPAATPADPVAPEEREALRRREEAAVERWRTRSACGTHRCLNHRARTSGGLR